MAWAADPSSAELLQLLPEWARNSLTKHSHDKRDKLLDLNSLRKARSGDAVWDALQLVLIETGELHNNARMGWGKALLRWTPNPESCCNYLLDLNNRFALDGHAPPSYGTQSYSNNYITRLLCT